MIETYKEQFKTNGEITLKVKVHAQTRETRIKSVLTDGVIKIDIQATPEKGKGNEALCKFLSEEFEVPVSSIQIVMGKFSADKTVKITI
ncbi:MAG TPA: DUF167 domain-containing protein [bacterium]|nr:DUF167 domain-containing protein [bacterium]